MGGVIDRENALPVHLGIDLCGREGGVPQQLLDLAQVATGREKMRRKRVAERVRRCRVRKGESVAHPRDCELDQAGRERTALGAEKEGTGGLQRIWAERDV